MCGEHNLVEGDALPIGTFHRDVTVVPLLVELPQAGEELALDRGAGRRGNQRPGGKCHPRGRRRRPVPRPQLNHVGPRRAGGRIGHRLRPQGDVEGRAGGQGAPSPGLVKPSDALELGPLLVGGHAGPGGQVGQGPLLLLLLLRRRRRRRRLQRQSETVKVAGVAQCHPGNGPPDAQQQHCLGGGVAPFQLLNYMRED